MWDGVGEPHRGPAGLRVHTRAIEQPITCSLPPQTSSGNQPMLASRCLAVLVAAALGAEAIRPLSGGRGFKRRDQVQFAIGPSEMCPGIGWRYGIVADARLDLADVKPREQTLTIKRQVLEYRLRLAGNRHLRGADDRSRSHNGHRCTGRSVTADEVVAAARSELFRWLLSRGIRIGRTRPACRSPLARSSRRDSVTIAAVPHAKNRQRVWDGFKWMWSSPPELKSCLHSVWIWKSSRSGARSTPIVQVSGVLHRRTPHTSRIAELAPAVTNPTRLSSLWHDSINSTPNPVIPASGTTPINSITPVEMPHPNSRYSKGIPRLSTNRTAVMSTRDNG